MVQFLVVAELVERTDYIQFYLFVDDCYFFRELVEDVDDILAEKDDGFLLVFINFQLTEIVAAGAGYLAAETSQQVYDALCEFFYLFGSLFVEDKLLSQNCMEQCSLFDQHLTHSYNSNYIILDRQSEQSIKWTFGLSMVLFIKFIKQKTLIEYMAKHTIPEMSKTLDELNNFFKQKSISFCQNINHHEGKFTQRDYTQFKAVVQDIKVYATKSIRKFFDKKITDKCEPYESQIFNFSERSTQTCDSLKSFRQELEESTVEMKITQNRKQELLQHFSQKYGRNATLKKFWRILQKHTSQCRQARIRDQQMVKVYHFNLMKKSFFPWRRLTYKEGYENRVKNEVEQDLQQIHSQYQSIIDIMKAKIADTDEIIKVKRAAKGEFAYALSKNLLKTISNLSMEVMSLNQMSLNDGQISEKDTRKFMKQVDDVITQKLKTVRQYKTSLSLSNVGEDQHQPRSKKKKITFA